MLVGTGRGVKEIGTRDRVRGARELFVSGYCNAAWVAFTTLFPLCVV